MFKPKYPPIVISIGGSLIVPNGGTDIKFLKKLNTFIRKHVNAGRRFFLVTGGGKIARHYRDAGKEVIGSLTNDDLDWLGIHATHLNAHLLRTIFKDIAHPRIIQNYDKKLNKWKEPVVVGAGWKPGWSTDYDAVILARDYGARLIVNLSNTDWVYDKDPNKYSDAKIIKKITWHEFEGIVGNKWTPGLNTPFDPVAAQLAKLLKLKVIVTNGNDFRNLDNIIEGKHFKGSIIMPYHLDANFYDKEYYDGKKGEYLYNQTTSILGKSLNNLRNLYRAILIKIQINPKTVLDIGCGTGRLVKWLRIFGINAVGVDFSKDAVDLANSATKQYLSRVDITKKLPFDEKSFDLVTSFDVLEHIDQAKIRDVIEESARVSKKYILHKIYTTENDWINLLHRNDASHISVFSKHFWKTLFQELEIVSITRDKIFTLPTFFETTFLLKRK